MKMTNRSFAFLLAMLAGAGITFSGCASTGIQRSNDAATTMQTMDDKIQLIVVQLDATGASLDELTKPGQSDVGKAYDLYTSNLSKIETMQKDFAGDADAMAARGQEYFAEWKKEGDQYKNPRIQALSDQRRIELGTIYGKIASNSIGVRDDFKAYVSNAREIQIYLSNDLTPKGIEAITPIAGKTVSNGAHLKNSIQDIQTAIQRASAEMSQGGTSLPGQ